MLVDAQAIPQMAYYGDKYDAERFVPVATCYGRELKPNWGFWASPLIDNDTSEWTVLCEQCRMKMGHKSPTMQNITIHGDAEIFVIDTEDDALWLQEKYEWKWEDMAMDLDAVYVTRAGDTVLFDGYWEVPSIVFFNTDSFTVN